ncbi:ATP-binding protein, partial [Phenylobacterium sp.]|uniref:ATP-binding protein n=1 Tax=Phenylobacterium sp. TaxID=1871053 RepID=UPI00271809AD
GSLNAVVSGLCDTPEEQMEFVKLAYTASENLLTIINDVLDIAKIESGKMDVRLEPVDAASVLKEVHALTQIQAQTKNLRFEIAPLPPALPRLSADPAKLRQILLNLAGNAIKFASGGTATISLRADPVVGYMQIMVADTGIGIPAERLASLFQKFEQADASTTRRYGGTGLGLAICRELAQLMGGAIEAQSAPGQGTTFVVSLPLAKSDVELALPLPTADEPRAGEIEVGTLRVLAAEDNTVNQLVLKTLLHQIGIHPTVVDNGALAVEAWARETWDVILMDVQMPEMDGPTATGVIRTREAAEGRARTPIIALTANAMAHQVAEYVEAGMDGFVAKPIEAGRLFAALQAVLEAASAVVDEASVAA